MLKGKRLQVEGQGTLFYRKLLEVCIDRCRRAVGLPHIRPQCRRSWIRTAEHIGNLPLLRQIEELPLAAALVRAVIVAVQLLPVRISEGRLPDNLRIRATEDVLPPALQLVAV